MINQQLEKQQSINFKKSKINSSKNYQKRKRRNDKNYNITSSESED